MGAGPLCGLPIRLHRSPCRRRRVAMRRSPGPVPTHAFTHALVQEATSGSFLPAWRRALHAQIVEALAALAGAGRSLEQGERLAPQALRGEVGDKAVTYCQ